MPRSVSAARHPLTDPAACTVRRLNSVDALVDPHCASGSSSRRWLPYQLVGQPRPAAAAAPRLRAVPHPILQAVPSCGPDAAQSGTSAVPNLHAGTGASVGATSAGGSAGGGTSVGGTSVSATSVSATSGAVTRGGAAAETKYGRARISLEPPVAIRGLYVNRFAAQSPKKMRALIALADSTEINAFVIDMKDEFGVNYASADRLVQRNAGHAGVIADLPALLDTLRVHHILAIARIVVFKDTVAARHNPDWTIRQSDGEFWHDKQGMRWVNPYNRQLWEYDIRVAEDAARLGFGEVQFDYIRFPEPYKSLPEQVYPGADSESKAEILAEFLRTAKGRVDKLGVRTTADIFGMVASMSGALEVGQKWDALAPTTDVLLPMVYPSHYPRGSFQLAAPNAEPYKVVFAAVSAAYQRDKSLGISGERVRPWLQAFTLGMPHYGPAQLQAQMQAVYDAGYQGWVLWNPGSQYHAIEPALRPKHSRGSPDCDCAAIERQNSRESKVESRKSSTATTTT